MKSNFREKRKCCGRVYRNMLEKYHKYQCPNPTKACTGQRFVIYKKIFSKAIMNRTRFCNRYLKQN